MLKLLTDIFRSDEFISGPAVFPDIDKERLARDLGLEEAGRKRGAANLPEAEASDLDHHERQAIGRVEELRRRGLESYEINLRVYSERLNKAASAKALVETHAKNSKSKFTGEVKRWRSKMVTLRERVQETYRWRNRFRDMNKLERPAKAVSSLVNLIGLAFVMILLESVGNAYLFAQKNTLGLLGGLMAAFLVSLGNVSLSTLLGMGTRYVNCRSFRNLLKRLAGLSSCLIWIGFAAGYNMAVAHFRDAVERNEEWREAGTAAIRTLLSSPASLHTMESYILLLLGLFISIIAFLKGYTHSDPYPNYSKVSQDVIDARDDYVRHLEESIDALAEHLDDAVNGLREANDEVHRNINDSVDALYGQKALRSNLVPFLEQCDDAANYLLSVYRDANKAARTAKIPKHFKTLHAFERFEPAETTEDDDVRRRMAEEQVGEVSDMVNTAVKEIFEVFHDAMKSHSGVDELEGTYIERAARYASPEAHAKAEPESTRASSERETA